MINFKDALSQHRPWQPSMCPNVQWFAPGDTESEWQANMNNTKRRGYLERQGWHHAHAIEYRYNQDGFRGSDFDLQQRALMVLGCSFTFGVGLAEKQVWPWIVAAQLGMPCMNLAWGGCGSDRCFRMAEYWVPRARPKYVVMLTPPRGRVELILNDDNLEAQNFMPQNAGIDSWFKMFISADENSRINEIKNQLAIREICVLFDIPCLIYKTDDLTTILGDKRDHARDFRHQGPNTHRAFAERVTQDLLTQAH